MNWNKKKLMLSLPYKIIALFITSSLVIITVLKLFNWDVPLSTGTYYGSVWLGMLFGAFLGIPFSYVIEGFLYILKIRDKRTYHFLHVILHTIAGSFLPIIGNMYAFSTVVLYLLLLQKHFKAFTIIVLTFLLATLAALLL